MRLAPAPISLAALLLSGILLVGCSSNDTKSDTALRTPMSSTTIVTVTPSTPATATTPNIPVTASDSAAGTNRAGITTDPADNEGGTPGQTDPYNKTGTTGDGTVLCGLYHQAKTDTSWELVINKGSVSCDTARATIQAWDARQGTVAVTEHSAAVNGFVCADTSAGDDSQGAIREYCDDPATAAAVQNHQITGWRQAANPTHFELEMS